MESFKYNPLSRAIAVALLASMPLLAQASASKNELTVNVKVPGAKYAAGYSNRDKNNANENKVTIEKGTNARSVTGGLIDIISGKNSSSANNNMVTMKGGEVETVFGGLITPSPTDSSAIPSSGTTNDNRVIIEGGTAGQVQGGLSFSGNASNNQVTVTTATVGAVLGGQSISGNTDNNTVTINESTPTDSLGTAIRGGISQEGDSSGNRVFLNGGKALDILGGTGSLAKNNSVEINKNSTVYYVYGGTGNAGSINNTVTVNSGTVLLVEGGHSGGFSSGNATNNNIIINGGNVGYATGGSSTDGSATDNNVTVNDGYAVFVEGGSSNERVSPNAYSESSRNTVTINGGTVVSVMGGLVWSAGDTANNNIVNITGDAKLLREGDIDTSGFGSTALPTFAESSIYGGINPNFSSFKSSDVFTGNTLNFSASPVNVVSVGNFEKYNFTIKPEYANTQTALITADEIKLGYAKESPSKIEVVGVHAGKALNVADDFVLMQATDSMTGYGQGITSKGVAQQGIALLYDIETKVDTENRLVTATVIGNQPGPSKPTVPSEPPVDPSIPLTPLEPSTPTVPSEPPVEPSIPLTPLEPSTPTVPSEPPVEPSIPLTPLEPSTPTVPSEPPVEPSTPLTPLEPSKPVVPTAPPVEKPGTSPGAGGSNSGKPAGRINPQLKALSEGYIAGAMLVNRGADTVAFDAFDAIDTQNSQGGLAPFVTLSASRTRYNSGSHVKSNDVVLSSGLSFKQDNITMGAFLETGRGSYDSYNSFSNAAKVHGSGNTRYYGAGLLGRYTFDNQIYTDASVRFGRTRTKFDTSDIQNLVTGDAAKYNLRSNYMSAHIGAGYVMSLDEQNTLDLSAKYLRSSVDGAKVNIAGDSIDFDRVNSDRVRANALFSHAYSETVSFNAGVGYEHEFDSKTKATAHTIQGDLKIDAPDVKGGTGIFSLGATVTPSADKNFSLDFNVDAYTGKREGAGASIRAGYAF